jgi:hypothetical protein
MHGFKDPELMVRWLQFGVFSPINRLHSSNSLFSSKEPWNYGQAAERAMGIFLRLRHRLIPYLYTMCRRASVEYRPLIEPLYYSHPEHSEAYTHGNQYWLGSELMIAPITEKSSAVTGKASVEAWLPPGKWLDFFSGTVYRGGKTIRLWRGLEEAPVFIRQGGIVPLALREPKSNGTENPRQIRLIIFPLAGGRFTLYEDEGEGNGWKEGRFAETEITWERGEPGGRLRVEPRGDLSALPEKRSYAVVLQGIRPQALGAPARLSAGGLEIYGSCRGEIHGWEFLLPELDRSQGFTLECPAFEEADPLSELEQRFFAVLNGAPISFDQKGTLYRLAKEAASQGFGGKEGPYRLAGLAATLQATVEDRDLLSMMMELIGT